MNRIDVRASITQAKFNEESVNTLFAEIAIAAIALGLLTKSWWIFGIAFVGLILGLRFRKFAVILCIIFSLCWGVAGYFVGALFSSLSASIVLAIIGLLAGLGGNFAAIEWVRDMGNQS